MVLQQKHEVPFFGKGTPGSIISIQPSWGKNVVTEVQADGSWMLNLRTPAAGGPHQIDVRHDDTVLTLRNVLLGEVWLCSGQSNMEMPLEGWLSRHSPPLGCGDPAFHLPGDQALHRQTCFLCNSGVRLRWEVGRMFSCQPYPPSARPPTSSEGNCTRLLRFPSGWFSRAGEGRPSKHGQVRNSYAAFRSSIRHSRRSA